METMATEVTTTPEAPLTPPDKLSFQERNAIIYNTQQRMVRRDGSLTEQEIKYAMTLVRENMKSRTGVVPKTQPKRRTGKSDIEAVSLDDL